MLDVVVRAQAGIETGTDVPGAVRFRLGGSAANTARAFAGLGGAAAFVGTRGQDELGRRLVAALRASGVTVHAVARRGVTPRLAAIVEPSGQRSFVTDRSVADDLPADGRQGGLVQECRCPAPAGLFAPRPADRGGVAGRRPRHAPAWRPRVGRPGVAPAVGRCRPGGRPQAARRGRTGRPVRQCRRGCRRGRRAPPRAAARIRAGRRDQGGRRRLPRTVARRQSSRGARDRRGNKIHCGDRHDRRR